MKPDAPLFLDGSYRTARRCLALLFGLALLFPGFRARATHIRAGEIIAERVEGTALTYRFTLTVYTDTASSIRDNENTLMFGDGSSQTSPLAERVAIDGSPTHRNTYFFQHTYPAPGVYVVGHFRQNRNTGIANISNSDLNNFYVQTQIIIDPFIGINNSPVLLNPPIDIAAKGQVFVHNPAAFDPDGDSLSYRMRVPERYLEVEERPIDVSNYRFPDNPEFGGENTDGGPATLTLDPETGDLVWNTPGQVGEFNVAFEVIEWRNGDSIGHVVRDMQIIVRDIENEPPSLEADNLCVIAGDTVEEQVFADDPNTEEELTIKAFSGVFNNNNAPQKSVEPPHATFTAEPRQDPIAAGDFRWVTGCQHVREDPYEVVFKVEDSEIWAERLVDFETMNIRVVGPPPQGLTVDSATDGFTLNWEPYQCSNASTISIYRRTGSSDFNPGCTPGIPPNLGYEKVGEVPADQTTFVDSGQAAPLVLGRQYCYRLVADFPPPGNGESVASAEVCTSLPADQPLVTQASVLRTHPDSGRVAVAWTPPLQLDSTELPPPYEYRVFRAPSPGAAFGENPVFTGQGLADTSFVDSLVNTTENLPRYKVAFFFGDAINLKGETPSAAVPELQLSPTPQSINLSWSAEVPWDNSFQTHLIFRRVKGDSAFTLIDSVDVGEHNFSYTDNGKGLDSLEKDVDYCYFVETRGDYANPRVRSPLENRSAFRCTPLLDTTAPPPVSDSSLVIENPDGSPLPPGEGNDSDDPNQALFTVCSICERQNNQPATPPTSNRLRWSADTSLPQDQQPAQYRVYYRPAGAEDFQAIATTRDTRFVHRQPESLAGCYRITALDLFGNESAPTRPVCVELCTEVFFPNVFTPNPGEDDINSTYRLDCISPQTAEKTRFTVYNRWGEQVAQVTDDVQVRWDGRGKNGELLSPGVYYWTAEIELKALETGRQRIEKKGWVHLLY